MAASQNQNRSILRWIIVGALVLTLNLHYVLLGESIVGGLFNSPLLEPLNAVWRHKTIQALQNEGVPPSNHTEDLGNGLQVDIYEPEHDNSDARPAALYFHAGAYALGFKELGAGTMRFLAHEGIVGISVGYRRSTKKGLDGSVDDAARALAWVREHASEIGVDPSRVFAVGDSAGGHIVLALALGLGAASKVNPPQAVIAGWPAVGTEPRHWLTYCADEFDMETCKEWADTPSMDLLNGTAAGNNVFLPPGKHRATEEGTHAAIEGVLSQIFMLHGKRAFGILPPQYDAERAQALSPLARVVDGSDDGSCAARDEPPPIMMFAGLNDTVVPFGQVRRFAEAYRRTAPVSLLAFRGADHGGGGANTQSGRDAIRIFLRRHGLGGAPGDSLRGDEAVEAAKRAFRVPPSFDYEFVYDEDAHANATVYVDPVSSEGGE